MVILLFYIGLFLSWMVAFKIRKTREFSNCLLLRFLCRVKNWFINQIKSQKNSKRVKNINQEFDEQHFPTLNYSDIPEKDIIQPIEPKQSIKETEIIRFREPFVEDIEDLLNLTSIDKVSDLTITSEPFIMPLLAHLDIIQKNKQREENPNQMSLVFINKEAKEVQTLKNKEIGELGEDYVMEFEKRLLSDLNINFSPLHISKEFDGYGYDILSFDKYGNAKYIEVKTTTQNEKSDFFLSQNEFDTMHKLENYFIYRLCNFNDPQNRKLIIINCKEELMNHFDLIPDTYKISKK